MRIVGAESLRNNADIMIKGTDVIEKDCIEGLPFLALGMDGVRPIE